MVHRREFGGELIWFGNQGGLWGFTALGDMDGDGSADLAAVLVIDPAAAVRSLPCTLWWRAPAGRATTAVRCSATAFACNRAYPRRADHGPAARPAGGAPFAHAPRLPLDCYADPRRAGASRPARRALTTTRTYAASPTQSHVRFSAAAG